MNAIASSTAAALAAAAQQALPSRELFLKALSQHARLINLRTPLPDAALIAERLHGREAVSAPYRFEIDCLSSSAHLSLARLIGEELSVSLLLATGQRRSWHGIVTAAAQLGADGGLARYRLRLEPWFALLGQRRNSRIFQDQTAEDILRSLFADYPLARFEFQHQQMLAVRALTTQYRETDLSFACRLLAEEGLSYRFEHDQSEGLDGEPGGTRHTLIVFDAQTPLPECAQSQIRYHRVDASEASDTLQRWESAQRVGTNSVARAGWDARQLLAHAGSAGIDDGLLALGEVPTLEDWEGAALACYADAAAAERAAHLRAQYLALAARSQRVAGSVRQLAAGSCFTVMQHPHFSGEEARFCVLEVEHEALDNLDSQASHAPQLQTRIDDAAVTGRGSYRNRARCVSASLPLVPMPLPRPRLPGLQTAIVVGSAKAHPGSGTHSERDHRIKIQFPWQRGAVPLAGGLSSATERATGDEANGTWVRVSEALAGPHWGSVFTPRIGSEVLVDFINGDPDHPLVVAGLYNGQDAPPWPAGEGSSANHPGVLAGFHAPTLDGAGWSQWQLDDATGQLRTRLATSFARSELNLGYLIHQTPTSSQRGTYRGQGFELRTDGWSITRAAQGMLLSTTARQHASSTQLDTAEAAGQLKAAFDVANRLSDAASQSEADPLAQAKQIDAFRAVISAPLPQAGEGERAGKGMPDDESKPFTAPAILIEAPASIALTTPQSATLFAGEQLSTSVQADTQITAQHTASLVSGEATSLYTHAGGIKAIAANAPLSIQSHDGPLEVLADQNVTVTSSNDEIHILASSKIVLQAGQSSITLEGAKITFACPGNFTAKGASHVMAGGGSSAASLGELPSGFADVVPAGVDHPSLAPDVFSQALGFAEYPSQWLPFSGLSVQVFKDKTQVAGESVPCDELFTRSYLTEAPTDLRYAVALRSGWAVEQSIDIAVPEAESAGAEEDDQ
ncbi:type VI secretion system Vgr family protein [Uliginosibacterium sediminicola]